MDQEKIVRAVRDVGFPILVALVLLWSFVVRLPADLAELTTSIERNTAALGLMQRNQELILTELRR